MTTINTIGCGNVGRTLLRLWHEARLVDVGQVVELTRERTDDAVAFIGAGQPITSIADLAPADIILIATPDDAIADSATQLADALGADLDGTVVFHCSGCLPSAVLAPVARHGAQTASVHPVKSFAAPEDAVRSFAGTPCAIEGTRDAVAFLRPLFEGIGATLFDVAPDAKPVYHAAAVFASNYLNALVETALRCHEHAGISRNQSLDILAPILQGTLENILRDGPAQALTGPIARGDAAIVETQACALDQWNPQTAALYRRLGQIALELAAEKHPLPPDLLDRLNALLATGGDRRTRGLKDCGTMDDGR